MATLAVTNPFSDGNSITASGFNTNYSDIVNYINNRNSGSATWDALSALSASDVPLVADNSTGTQDIVNLKDNSSTVFAVANGGVWTSAMQSGSRVYRDTSAQVVAHNTETKIQFNAETYDIQSEFDSSTNYRFTATATGKYLITATLELSGITAAGTSVLRIKDNGTIVSQMTSANATTTTRSITITDVLSVTAAHYLEIYLLQTSGDNMNVDNGATLSSLSIAKVA